MTVLQNILPVPKIVLLSQNLYAPTKLKFSGGQSQDPDGEIMSYDWILSDGRSFQGADIEVEISEIGQYQITLNVSDAQGGVGNVSYSFEIKENHPPVTYFELAKTEFKQFEMIPLESQSYDIDENQVLLHVWEMSDGSSYLGTHIFHFFETPGSHWIKLTALDESGATSEKMYDVTILESAHLPPVAKLKTSGLEENDYDLIGSIGVNSSYSYSEDGAITSTLWEMGDGTTYENMEYVTHSYKSPGVYQIRLTVTTEYGVSSLDSKEINVIALEDPRFIPSPFNVQLTGFDSNIFNPSTLSFSANLEGANYSSEDNFQLIVENNGIYQDLTSNLQRTASNKIGGQISLQEGKNNLKFIAYDKNRNLITTGSQDFYVGSRSLEVKLISANGAALSNIPVALTLVDDSKIKILANSSTGTTVFQNVPPFELDLLAYSDSGELFTGRVGQNINSVELQAVEFSQPTSHAQNDLNLGLAGWYYNPMFLDLIDTSEGKRLRLVVPPGNNTSYEKSFVAENSKYFSHSIKVEEVSEGSLIEVIAFNETTGEVDSKKFNSDDYSEMTFRKLTASVLGRRNDIIRFKVQIKSQADGVSFIEKLFNAYAQTTPEAGVVINGGSITESGFRFRLTLKDRISSAGFDNLNYLSVGNFNVSINNTAYNLTNDIYGEIDAGILIDEVQNLQVLNVYLRQGGTIINGGNLQNLPLNGAVITNGVREIRFEPNNAFPIFSLQDNLVEGVDAEFGARIRLTYLDGSSEDVDVPATTGSVISSQRFLVSHGLLNDSVHYDGDLNGQSPHYNLLSSWDKSAWEKGDFWAHPDIRTVLNELSSSGVGFKVGDVSNINGGSFEEHSAHKIGLEFDAQTNNFKSNDEKLTHDSLDDLEKLILDNPIYRQRFRFAFANFDVGGLVDKDSQNRCIAGRTMNNFIYHDTGHKDHWHFKFYNGTNIPSIASRVNYDFASDLSWAPGGDVEMIVSYPEFSAATSASFRIYRRINNKELFASYKDSTYTAPNNLFVAEYAGRTLKVRFNISKLGEILKGYKFTAMAARSSDGYCSQKEITIGSIDDCNNDGVKDDLAFITEDNGFVSKDVTLPDGVVVANGARICGNSTVTGTNITISGNNILENVQIGANCSSVSIQNDNFQVSSNKISDSQMCNKAVSPGNLVISGIGITVAKGSQLNGDLSLLEGANITASSIEGYRSTITTSNIYKSNISIFDRISGSTINDSSINGDMPSSYNNNTSLSITGALVKNNSGIKGIGYIRGLMDNGLFDGWQGFFRYDGYIVQDLFPSGSITKGGQAEQTGWIAGSITDGGFGRFYGTTYHHSGINYGASIGQGGYANCYNYVEAGTLRKSICHKVYNGNRVPDTQNIDDWIAGVPWPKP